ncbi:hypothetical protein CK203_098049 [Vitis vinifera]|uniref:DUF659 domain-containing protein n=1 Tax=Vitis vinifera TaxID=29760 RepID=A0A438CS43_VITVI|nr:hypothetical protein CK203_098049 [Vitis vinifera]
MKQAMKESRRIFEENGQEHQKGGSLSQPSNARIKRGLTCSFNVREEASIPPKGIDPFMFPSKQKSIKNVFSTEGVKKMGKVISKFFLFNAIPFNAIDSGPYYQSMIDTIAKAGPGIKGPTGYQIGNTYLENEVTRKPIINFMIYCDRSMIYHSSVDTINIPKTTYYIFSLMDKVVEEVGEENVVQVDIDNEASFKAASIMKQIKETLDQVKMITRFIYNSLKVVNLMKVFTKDRDLLRPGITRFATEFISLESRIRYKADLKRMCTTNEWREFNKDRSRKSLRDKVSNLILSDRFWKKAGEVQTIMEPLVKLLKLVDQDKKPTLSIIYEAMDRAKLTIKAPVKQWEKYWEVIDRRWEDEWIREGEEPILSFDNLDWLDKGFPTNEEGRERDVDSRRKGKASRTISSSSSSDDGDNRGSRRGGGTSGGNRGVGGTSEGTGGDGSTRGGYVSQVDPDMSWAQGGEKYYATQDTDHGY